MLRIYPAIDERLAKCIPSGGVRSLEVRDFEVNEGDTFVFEDVLDRGGYSRFNEYNDILRIVFRVDRVFNKGDENTFESMIWISPVGLLEERRKILDLGDRMDST